MDINAALARMRTLSATSTVDMSDLDELAELADDMAVVFQAIDGWLSKGGFKPSDWS